MELNQKTIKKILLIVFSSILLFWGLQNVSQMLQYIKWFASLFTPFIIGLCMAFILNVLLKLLEEKAFICFNRYKFWMRYRRIICIALSYLLVLAVVFFLVFLMAPELEKSGRMLASNMPGYIEGVTQWVNETAASLNISLESMQDFLGDWQNITSKVLDFIKNAFPDWFNNTVNVASGLFGGIADFVVGTVFSVYMLFQKESLCRNCRRIAFAFLSRKHAEYLISVGKLSNRIFARFVSGQLTEAVIIGVLCFIGMSIFRMPYALLISTIVSVTALIPIFGAFIGTAVGAFLLLMINPITAFWFVIFIIVLQQIEGNVIYPKVVGTSIGLPGIWVLFAVMVGGSLFGIMGMLIGIPISSVLYSLFRHTIRRRLSDKKISMTEINAAGNDDFS